MEQLDTLLQRFLDASHGANAQKSSVPAALKAKAEERERKDKARESASHSLVAETRWVEATAKGPPLPAP